MGRFLCHQRERRETGRGGGNRGKERERERLCLLHPPLLAPIRLAENIRPRLGTPQLCCIPSHVPLITNIRRHCQHIDSPIPRSVWAIDGSSRSRRLQTPPRNANNFLAPAPARARVSSERRACARDAGSRHGSDFTSTSRIWHSLNWILFDSHS